MALEPEGVLATAKLKAWLVLFKLTVVGVKTQVMSSCS